MTHKIDDLSGSNLGYELKDDGVLVLLPLGPLTREDFEKLTSVVDPWLDTHGMLRGVVISIKKFPGWEDFAGFIHHIEFINSHHKKVKRIALAVDGLLPELMSKVASHFIAAELKQFQFSDFNKAVQWVTGPN